MDEMYRVTLVDDRGVEYMGIANDKDEAALAALADHNRARAQHAWDNRQVTALPMLKTFKGYDEVLLYWEDVHGGCGRFDYFVLGPYDAPLVLAGRKHQPD